MSEHAGIGKLWTEIGRRNVGRVALVYAGAAWGLVHMSTVMAEALEIPHWVNRYLVFLLVALAPVIIGFSWVFEFTPEGFKRAAEVEQDPALSGRTARRLDIAIIALILALAGLYGAERFLLPHEATAPMHAAAEGAAKAPATEGAAVAVLPFVNLSSDKEQEFFSDGMTEEITSALAKIPKLPVVGRTSAFQFKGENKDLSAIGQALHATYLLEGSVRKAGERVRITAQLIRAKDDLHVWTESYDRDLKDVFAVQEDVAKAIAAALQVPLGLAGGERLVPNRTADTSSYEDYLRARALYRARDLETAITVLEKSVAADPSYAPAWAMLAESYSLTNVYVVSNYDPPRERQERIRAYMDKAEQAAEQALRLDAHNALAHAALAQVASEYRDWLRVDDQYRQALAIDPNEPDILNDYSSPAFLQSVGYLKHALEIREKLHHLEPLVPIYNSLTGSALINSGHYQAAIEAFLAVPTGGRVGVQRNVNLARALASVGRFGDAADTLLATPPDARPSRALIESAAALLRTAPTAKAAAKDLPVFVGALSFVYEFAGGPSHLLESIERGESLSTMWDPVFAPLRKTERFKAAVRKSGLLEYWRARGWPDVCHSVGADDFVCS